MQLYHLSKTLRIAAGAAVFALAFSSSAMAEQKTFKDVIGREVKADLPSKRVLLGFYFEDYMAVGGEASFDKVVGLSREAWEGWRPTSWTKYVAHRPSLNSLPDVGEVEAQTFSVEKVLELKPDMVVLADWQYKGLGLDAERIEEAGIAIAVVDFNAQTLERHLDSARVLGLITGQEGRAATISAEYKAAADQIAKRIADAKKPQPKIYVEFGNKGPAEYSFTYGKNMWGAMATASGGDNIAAPFVEWWGPINPEQVLASRPDVVVIAGTESRKNPTSMLMGEGIARKEAVERLKGFTTRAGWSQLPAVQNGRVYGVYQGASRSLADYPMMQFFAKVLYPELFADLNPEQAYKDFYKKYLPVTPEGTFTVSLSDKTDG
ncbi:ABC transporter substrate-binding protein [Allorhizobium undicola]|uniref:ABC transporter substrate-binding protein n=1 Tax=Allorhizobium undicola TaxID=78527 RepID=UPI000686A7AF|nr:ABC transporter substrate-binding protein [Allorhizobium undicola]